jgi:hypothetical protein
MSIKNLIQKLLAGEALPDTDRATLASFDPDSIAAAARKSATERALALETEKATLVGEVETLRSKLADAGKSEGDKIASALATANAKIAAIEKDRDEEKAKAAKLMRESKLTKILTGVQVPEGIKPAVVHSALASALSGLTDDELEGEKATQVVTAFAAENPALVVAPGHQGSGARQDGTKPGVSGKLPTKSRAEYDAMTLDQQSAFIGAGGSIKT